LLFTVADCHLAQSAIRFALPNRKDLPTFESAPVINTTPNLQPAAAHARTTQRLGLIPQSRSTGPRVDVLVSSGDELQCTPPHRMLWAYRRHELSMAYRVLPSFRDFSSIFRLMSHTFPPSISERFAEKAKPEDLMLSLIFANASILLGRRKRQERKGDADAPPL